MKAVAYIRISVHNDVSSIYSEETQRSLINQYAEQNGIEIIEWYSDINESGANENREGLSRAVNLAKRTGSHLIVKDLSRLSRKAHHCLALLAEVKVIDTTLGIEADDKVLAIMSLANQWEREAVSQRVRQTYQYLRQQYPDRTFGHPETLVQGRKTSAIKRAKNADEYCMKLAPLLMTDENHSQCAFKLMALGIPTRTGKTRWFPQSVKNMRLRLERLRELQ